MLGTSGIVLSEASLGLLLERTEGWAAGLRLAAISLAGHPEPERFVAKFSGSDRAVADYLLAEILNRQPEEVRQLLLRTSVLERVSGPLADLLTGSSGSERILLALEDANAFVVSLDAARSWFRYHHLLADLLRLELRRTNADSIRSLHRLAAQWYSESGHVIDAVRHLQAAADWQQAARLLADNLVSTEFDGRRETTHVLIAAFPAEAASADAELAALFAADQLIAGSFDAAAAYLTVAQRQAATLPDERRRRLDLLLAVVRLTLAQRRGDVTAVLAEVQSLEAASEAQTLSEVALSSDLRALALMNLGIVELLWQWRVEDARTHLEEALALARRIGRHYVETACLSHLAIASYPRSVSLFRRRSEEAIAIAEAHGWGDHPIGALPEVMFAAALIWEGRFDQATPWLDRAERAVGPEREPLTSLMLHLTRGMLAAGLGQQEQALTEFRDAERMQALLVTPEFAGTVVVRSFSVHAQVRLGETAAARAGLSAVGEEELDRGELRNAIADVCLAEGNPRAAVEALAPILQGSAAVLHSGTSIHALLLEAAAREQLGDPGSAEAAVERALELAEPDRMILPFAMTPISDLLERQPRRRTSHAPLLADILDVLAGSSPATRHGDAVTGLEELSDAELRVLRYLPSHLAAAEIAAELYLSTHTVKTHMRHLYAKLDVHSRTRAVERARVLGLLAPSSRPR